MSHLYYKSFATNKNEEREKKEVNVTLPENEENCCALCSFFDAWYLGGYCNYLRKKSKETATCKDWEEK